MMEERHAGMRRESYHGDGDGDGEGAQVAEEVTLFDKDRYHAQQQDLHALASRIAILDKVSFFAAADSTCSPLVSCCRRRRRGNGS